LLGRNQKGKDKSVVPSLSWFLSKANRKDNAMNPFVQQHAKSVIGMIRGWDRLRFRGTIRMLANVTGMNSFLSYTRHRLKDFGEYAQQVSRQVRSASLAVAESLDRPVVHLDSPLINKEQIALDIARRDGVGQGLIAVVTAVESCHSYNIRSNRQKGLLELYPQPRKCQHLYHYMIHPVFGLLYVRLQTWFPFNVFVGLNGREWLGRQMDAAGIRYLRHDNCFTRISDPEAAQRLADKQVSWNWEQSLGELGRQVNPALPGIVGGYQLEYYWSLDQSERASDVMFRRGRELDRLFPDLVRHAMESFRSPQVMSFLGRSVARGITPRFSGEVISDLRRRVEGSRVKHSVNRNSVKMYNKAASVLRVETTLNDVRDMQSPRVIQGKKVWRRMRKGVSDIARRAEVSDASNDRYLEALASVSTPLPLKTLSDALSKPTHWNGRPARGLNLLGQDAALLELIGGGEFLINGFRNRDVHKALFGTDEVDKATGRKRSGQVTRKLRLLRAHGLIRKVPHTHRYLVTSKGRQIIAALHAAREADIHKLTKAA
jgi:hypothetical protein